MAQAGERSAREAQTQESRRERPVWRVRSAGPLTGIALGWRSASQSWRLLAAVALGMTLTVMSLAVVPIYTALVTTTQVAAEVHSATPTDRNIEITAEIQAFYRVHVADIDAQVAAVREHDMPAGVLSGETEFLQAEHAYSLHSVNGQPIFTDRIDPATGSPEVNSQAMELLDNKFAPGAPLSFLAYNYADAAPYMKIYAGRLPKPTPPDQPPEVIVTPAFGAQPGQLLTIGDPSDKARSFTVKVVGVWFPKDEDDPFWNGHGFDTNVPLEGPPPPYYLLLDRSTFETLFSYSPTSDDPVALSVAAHYIWFINPDAVTADNQNAVVTGVQTVRNDLNGNLLGTYTIQRLSLGTRLPDILSQGLNLFDQLRLPLYSVAAELVVIALYFIGAMTSMLIESQSGVIATLRSRGASLAQLLAGYATQGVALAALGLVIGPIAAMAVSIFVLVTLAPAARAAGLGLSPGAIFANVPWSDVARPALAGAGLGLAALLIAVWSAARADALAFRRRQGGRARAPFWQRYYLDLFLVALVIAGYVELASFGALGTRQLLLNAGVGQTFDYAQVLTPALTMIVGALLVLRAAPWLLRLSAWVAARGRGATGMLAFSQLSRASGAFNRLVLLLALAVGLGLFALTFQTTVARAAVDQAYYLAGADERVVLEPEEAGTPETAPLRAQFARAPGVQGVTPLYRSVASLAGSSSAADPDVDVLGVDAANFAQVGAWRGDYANQSLPQLMATLKSHIQGANAGDATHPMSALVSQHFVRTTGLGIGGKFQLDPKEALFAQPFQFEIVGIVNDFPTMYDENPTGFIITNLNDYLSAIANPYLGDYPINGPNEFLLKTTASMRAAAQRASDLTNPNDYVDSTLDARKLTTTYQDDPLSAGLTGLLLMGAAVAALLSLLAALAQAGAAVSQRATQFAILRTLGLEESSLLRMLLTEQAMIYLTGAVAGVAISALLAFAALPFLSFGNSSYQPPAPSTPTPILSVNYVGSGGFMVVLLVAFAVALALAGIVARSSGLGKALRVGED